MVAWRAHINYSYANPFIYIWKWYRQDITPTSERPFSVILNTARFHVRFSASESGDEGRIRAREIATEDSTFETHCEEIANREIRFAICSSFLSNRHSPHRLSRRRWVTWLPCAFLTLSLLKPQAIPICVVAHGRLHTSTFEYVAMYT